MNIGNFVYERLFAVIYTTLYHDLYLIIHKGLTVSKLRAQGTGVYKSLIINTPTAEADSRGTPAIS
jgi:hypothetical protein